MAADFKDSDADGDEIGVTYVNYDVPKFEPPVRVSSVIALSDAMNRIPLEEGRQQQYLLMARFLKEEIKYIVGSQSDNNEGS